MALKTCATNNNLHPKGFVLVPICYVIHMHVVHMFLLAQKMTHVNLQAYALSLFITKTQFTLEKKNSKKKKCKKHGNLFHNAFTFQECYIWLLFYSSLLPYLFMDYVMFSCCWYYFRITMFTHGGKINNWIHTIEFLNLTIAWDSQQ